MDDKDTAVSGNVSDVVAVEATNDDVSADVDSTAIKCSYYLNGSMQCRQLL